MVRKKRVAAYLDIETDWHQIPTVVGVYREGRMLQLVGEEITREHVLEMLDGVDVIYTFWGHRFDMPRIRATLDLDLRALYETVDLADACHRANLYGGLKKVEKEMCIERELPDIDGKMAMALWESWCTGGNERSLEKLLIYNAEDCKNLETLMAKLAKLEKD